ncbi:hypothetical protein B0H21DRAFT_686033, partial [Amylocystis lapponica]
LPREVFLRRAKTVKNVSNAIKKSFGAQYNVELFGSTCYGVDSQKSDLDLVILDPDRPKGFCLGTTVFRVSHLVKIIRKAGFSQVYGIPKATVPIVKFVDPRTQISCDLNVNDRLGLINTAMLRRYCDLAPTLRPVIASIKNWARSLGLNDPAGAKGAVSFSSYTLSLMTVALFQMKGLLPNLQGGFEGSDENNNDIFWFRQKERRICCDTRYSLAEDWIPSETLKVQDAMLLWFKSVTSLVPRRFLHVLIQSAS